MSTFVYTAKKANAETVMGKVSAKDQDEAIDLISQLGYLPVKIEEESQQKKIKVSLVDKGQKVKAKDIYLFSHQLANLLKSGVSLLKALMILEQQNSNVYFQKVIANIIAGIKNGRAFSDCLSEYPNIFSSLYVTMVHAGEESGNLQELLVNISIHQRNQEELMSKVRTALAYPCLMAVVGFGTVYFILTFALPKMATLFEHMGKLPLPTMLLIGLSQFLGKTWIYSLIICAGTFFYLKRWIQTAKAKSILSRVSLTLPLFGEVVLKTELARFCRTMNLLLRSGVSIIRSLTITIPILSNEIIKSRLADCKESLTTGGSFGQSLARCPEIPAMMAHLVTVGEESGNLPIVLNEIAENYEHETDEKIKIMTTLLEPLMILVIGAVVGFIVFAMLLPIFQIDILAN